MTAARIIIEHKIRSETSWFKTGHHAQYYQRPCIY